MAFSAKCSENCQVSNLDFTNAAEALWCSDVRAVLFPLGSLVGGIEFSLCCFRRQQKIYSTLSLPPPKGV